MAYTGQAAFQAIHASMDKGQLELIAQERRSEGIGLHYRARWQWTKAHAEHQTVLGRDDLLSTRRCPWVELETHPEQARSLLAVEVEQRQSIPFCAVASSPLLNSAEHSCNPVVSSGSTKATPRRLPLRPARGVRRRLGRGARKAAHIVVESDEWGAGVRTSRLNVGCVDLSLNSGCTSATESACR